VRHAGALASRMATVLVVDDERMTRQLETRALNGAGVTVVEARDGFEALAVLSSRWREFTTVIVDTEMPGLHGWEVIRFVACTSPAIRILRLGRVEDVVPAPEYQMFQRLPVLAKPFTPTELLVARRSGLGLRVRVRRAELNGRVRRRKG
jgi:CheY-like chemotaxis protein